MRTTRFCALAGIALTLAACSDDNPWMYSDGEGGIRPALKADASVKDVVPTRADALEAPEINSFKIALRSADGSYSKQWESINDFPTDGSYKIGGYTFEAWYGDPDEEGFGKPYFYGSQEFTVKESETTDVNVTATLANCMVSIDYTQDFKNFFPEYNTKLHSVGGDYIEYAADETRPVFLKPGEVSFLISLTKQNGISGTFEPASIQTQARHHYHITFDANQGNNGDVQLQILFDDSLDQETVEIDLTDELMLTPAPRVACQGFTSDTPYEFIEGSNWTGTAKFTVIAGSELTSVKLTTQSESLLSQGWPAEIDLLSASATDKALMESLGLKTIGLSRKPGQMAQIDLTNVLPSLTGVGQHSFTVVAKDKMTKVNDPVSLVINTQPVTLSISDASVGVNETTASAVINYNGDNFMQNVKLQILNSYNAWQDAPIISATPITRAGQDYNVTFTVPAGTKDIKVRALFNGTIKDEGTITCRGLSLNIAPQNVWATKAIANVAVASIYNWSDVKMYVSQGGGSFSEWTNVTRDPSAKTVTLNGLTPGTAYRVTASATGAFDSANEVVNITTESALQPENANMDAWSTLRHEGKKTLFVGGPFDEYFANATAAQTYWATRNPMTISNNSTGTLSYTNPCGTYPVNNGSGKAAAVSTVGWGSGTTWAGGASVISNKSAGYLFMGDYSYDGSEHFSYGRPFASRPTSLTFDYKLTTVSSESCQAYVVIENRTNGVVTELGRGTFESNTNAGDFTTKTVNINYSNTALKATHAYIVFVSSTAASPATPNRNNIATGNAHQGNVFTVDNIKFNY